MKFELERVENIVGKGENAGYQHFLLFPQCFQKLSFPELLKVGSLAAFKTYLDREKPILNKLYLIGGREYQIIHTRLRNKCSSLNFDLFQKNLVASPLCQCGGIEASLLGCTYYTIIRNKLFATIENFTTVSLDVLLFSAESLTFQENATVFLEVQSFIKVPIAANWKGVCLQNTSKPHSYRLKIR